VRSTISEASSPSAGRRSISSFRTPFLLYRLVEPEGAALETLVHAPTGSGNYQRALPARAVHATASTNERAAAARATQLSGWSYRDTRARCHPSSENRVPAITPRLAGAGAGAGRQLSRRDSIAHPDNPGRCGGSCIRFLPVGWHRLVVSTSVSR